MDKPWWKSRTAWGGVCIGGGMVLSGTGNILLEEGDFCTNIKMIVAGIGIVLIAVGLRDAISKIPKK